MEQSSAHRHTIRLATIAILAALFSAMPTSCRRAPQWRIAEGAVWNTTYRIVYEAGENLDDSIMHVMQSVERSLSPFNDSTLISRINRGETDSTDHAINTVFALSQQVNRLSEGRFDPTVSPLVNLWGFGYDRTARQRIEQAGGNTDFTIPQAEIDSALRMVGIADCAVNNGRIKKKHPSTTFNFSAVTKGLGCDMIADMLRRNGTANLMVEIGGEIALAGHNPEGQPWRIQIDTPAESAAPTHAPLRLIALSGGGVATSGNYRNFLDTNRYGRVGHTIDPLTGMPVHTDVVSATVTAPTCALADALATACMASTAQQALTIIGKIPEAECLLVVNNCDTLHTVTSPGFPLHD